MAPQQAPEKNQAILASHTLIYKSHSSGCSGEDSSLSHGQINARVCLRICLDEVRFVEFPCLLSAVICLVSTAQCTTLEVGQVVVAAKTGHFRNYTATKTELCDPNTEVSMKFA